MKHAGEALEGKAAVGVSAVWLRDPSSDCVSPCFLDQGHFITKICGAGDCTNRLVSSHLDDTSVGRLPAIDVCFIIIIF